MITSDYGNTTTGTGDFAFDLSRTSTASTTITFDIQEYIDKIAHYERQMRLLFWKFWFGGGIWDDLKTYKVIERPKVVEIYRRLAKHFWTGKNFKKM